LKEVLQSALLLHFKNYYIFSGLACDWTSGVGRLDPYITSGSIKTLSVTSEDEC